MVIMVIMAIISLFLELSNSTFAGFVIPLLFSATFPLIFIVVYEHYQNWTMQDTVKHLVMIGIGYAYGILLGLSQEEATAGCNRVTRAVLATAVTIIVISASRRAREGAYLNAILLAAIISAYLWVAAMFPLAGHTSRCSSCALLIFMVTLTASFAALATITTGLRLAREGGTAADVLGSAFIVASHIRVFFDAGYGVY